MRSKKHITTPVQVGSVTIGGGAPVVIQSMTDTDTADRAASVRQILTLVEAGSEIVRLTVNNAEAAQQIPYIKEALDKKNCHVPLVGDFHYNGHVLLSQYPACAEALDKYRINPGNVGFSEKKENQFRTLVEIALRYDKPIRIGVNWGSVEKAVVTRLMNENAQRVHPKTAEAIMQEALVTSTLESAAFAQSLGLPAHKIVLSCKVSHVQTLIQVYHRLAERSHFALHVGLTEAGIGAKGIVASSIGIGLLLQAGIGDTIRTSLTPKPGAERAEEVYVSQYILQVMGLRSFVPLVTACPGCGRTSSTFFRELADQIQTYLQQKMPVWRRTHPGAATLSVAVMGCVVNGPGESKQANIGISLPGTGEEPVAPVFIDGQKTHTLRGNRIAEEFIHLVEHYVMTHYQEEGV